MTDLVILAAVAAILFLAGRYVYRAKKRGAKCIGCGVGGSCCSCSTQPETEVSCDCGCGCCGEKTEH